MKKTLLATSLSLLASHTSYAEGLSFAKEVAKPEAPQVAALQAAKPVTPQAVVKDDTSESAKAKHLYTTKRWSYSGLNGPRNWANLHRNFSACSGNNQSPINLTGFTESVLRPIEFNYQPEAAALLNNGHTVQLNYRQPKYIKAEGSIFNLMQFHFHSPSENQINGVSYPLEAHFVHKNDSGDLAMVSVMFEEGAENPALARSISQLPMQEGHQVSLESPTSPDELLPSNRDYYRFNGSLTIPPCTEGVRWFVLKSTNTASGEQIKAIRQALGHANNRPVQALNARMVLK